MTELMDAMDMTAEDVHDVDECMNCLTVDEGTDVAGWGWLCSMCYEDFMGHGGYWNASVPDGLVDYVV